MSWVENYQGDEPIRPSQNWPIEPNTQTPTYGDGIEVLVDPSVPMPPGYPRTKSIKARVVTTHKQLVPEYLVERQNGSREWLHSIMDHDPNLTVQFNPTHKTGGSDGFKFKVVRERSQAAFNYLVELSGGERIWVGERYISACRDRVVVSQSTNVAVAKKECDCNGHPCTCDCCIH